MRTLSLTHSGTHETGFLGRTAGNVRRYLANRRALAQLARADDHMLHDIGLNRADLEQFRRLW